MTSAQDFKSLGNQAFSAGQFPEAVEWFTKAIEADPSNHVLYSNRSAAYCSLKEYTKALEDATQTVKIKPDWPKGYSRKGAALHGLLQFTEAVEAYKKGLEVDPSNALLKKGLEEAETAAMSSAGDANPMAALANMFGPDMWAKLSANPKTATYLAQPDYVAKLQEIQGNPSLMNKHMNDPRIMTTIMALMGINADVATSAEEAAKAMEKDEPMTEAPKECPVKKQPAAPQKQPEPEVELTDEERAKKGKRDNSDAEKALGNAAYKKKDFETAVKHYNKAWELDETNVAVLTNKAAVLFEMESYEECIKVCEEAVEVGRSIFADYKLMARALGRIGSAYVKLNQLENAIKYFEKSLAEHRTPDILTKLRDTEKAKREADKEMYRDSALSDKAREEGNTLFKEQNYAEAIKAYTEAIKRNDQDARNYTNRAACYVKLMALAEADKDCDEAMRLDPKFAKGYVRKAAVHLAKRDFMKAMEWLKEAKEKDTDGKSAAEIEQLNLKCYQGLNDVQSGANREETLKRAQSNPEVQKILADPVMQSILKQMQENPAAAQEHLKNPGVANKINTLINAGVISIR